MAIDKESSGVPEFDPARQTTQVNLFIIVAVVLFFCAMFAVLVHFAHSAPPTANHPSPATQDAPIVQGKANDTSIDHQSDSTNHK